MCSEITTLFQIRNYNPNSASLAPQKWGEREFNRGLDLQREINDAQGQILLVHLANPAVISPATNSGHPWPKGERYLIGRIGNPPLSENYEIQSDDSPVFVTYASERLILGDFTDLGPEWKNDKITGENFLGLNLRDFASPRLVRFNSERYGEFFTGIKSMRVGYDPKILDILGGKS